MEEGNYKAVVAALLETAGLNYGALPKGLLNSINIPKVHVLHWKNILPKALCMQPEKVVK